MSIQLRPGFQNETLNRVLEDLLVRFVINAPPEDLSSNSRIFFLFEEAHWFYLDYVRTINPSLPMLKMRAFSKSLIQLFPFTWKGGDPDEALKEFVSYKQSIPVRGAALFNSSLKKVLLVQGTESTSWSFPRGKISKDEDDADCAVREVKEEIGFDITPYLKKDDYVERTFKGKNYRIYLCKDIPEDFDFKPLVRNEINEITWKDFKGVTKKIMNGSGSDKFFLIKSMITPIQQWINKNKGEVNETQLKLEVEAALKSLLGIGGEFQKPEIDPGRELLDFIRQSAARKQQREQELKPAAQEQPLLQPLQPPQPPIPFPVAYPIPPPPFPMAGFQPPLLPFIHPFVPPHDISGIPSLSPFPLYSNQPTPPQQFQAPPSVGQLSRPTFNTEITKNEKQSRELLNILKNTSGDKKSNAKELLNFLHKREDLKTGTSSGINSAAGTSVSNVRINDHSKNLLALLGKKPTESENKTGIESKSQSGSPSQALLNLIKPKQKTPDPQLANPPTQKKKLTILKRGDAAVSNAAITNVSISSLVTKRSDVTTEQQNVSSNDIKQENDNDEADAEIFEEFDEDEEDENLAPSSKELIELIKQSKKEHGDGEIFEELSEDEFELDDHEDEREGESDQFYDADTFEEEQKDNEALSRADKHTPSRQQQETEATASTPPPACKPKFKILKRGEDLNDFLNGNTEQNKAKAPEVEDEDYGDDITVEEHIPESPEVKNDDSGKQSALHADEYKIETPEAKKDKNKPEEEEEESKHEIVENAEAKNDILNLLHKGLNYSAPVQTVDEIESKFNAGSVKRSQQHEPAEDKAHLGRLQNEKKQENTSQSLLNLLHKKPEPVDISSVEENLEGLNLAPRAGPQSSTPLLDLLKGNAPSTAPPTQQIQEQPPSTSSPKPGADLLNLLHRKPSPHAVEPNFHKTNGSPANDLLTLLHKSKEPSASPSTQPEELPRFQNTTGSPANDLLNLLHRG